MKAGKNGVWNLQFLLEMEILFTFRALCVCYFFFFKYFLNGFLHQLKAIIFLFGGKIMKYINTRLRNKMLDLFTKISLSLQIFVVFCFAGQNKSNIPKFRQNLWWRYITAYYWWWCFCCLVSRFWDLLSRWEDRKSKEIMFLSLCKSPQWQSQAEV